MQAGKSKGKGKVRRSTWTGGVPPSIHATPLPTKRELEAAVEDDDDNDEEGGDVDIPTTSADNDAEWGLFKSALLATLQAGGQPMSAGKLGHELSANKKAVAAGLFQLMEAGSLRRAEGVPPKWSAVAPARGRPVTVQIPARFAYDETKKKANPGPRSSATDFEALKVLVRSALGGKGQGGGTAGALGYQLGAARKAVNAALYACEKEGTAWTLSDKESGAKLRWAAAPTTSPGVLPACFSYAGNADGAAGAVQQSAKKARVEVASFAAAGPGDPFEDLKMLLRAHVFAKGDGGVTSGRLGFELNANRKAVNAALYSCEAEGTVQNMAGEGNKPTWVGVLEPPEGAIAIPLPPRFAYGGDKEPGAVAGPAILTAAAVAGGGKGKGKARVAPAAAMAVAASAAAVSGAAVVGGSAVAALHEWAQKNGKVLLFSEVGQDGSGNFLCECCVDTQKFPPQAGRNKKQAKINAAVGVMQALRLS
eukprot:NODE_259_length_1733_cov_169.679976.p1 GENE.NODE_259_length_1733_cov_169.679976~~NODE_259_length_1733_cov_169.679976.p1  ORF type:complete len:479 (+),score=148.60 NODE_259_length_1733_cov_169.679976:92-1528(+)